MKTILTIGLLLTTFGAMNTLLNGMIGNDIIQIVMGVKRTSGSDFLRILIGFSAIIILGWGLKKIYSENND